jgi:aminopeptidase YwaD
MALACGSSSPPPPTATSAPPATPTAPNLGPPQPEAGRILEHIRALSAGIGPRLAGSAAEDEAVAYARGQLEEWGYDVEVQDFAVSGPDVYRPSSVIVDGEQIVAASLRRSASGEVTGRLVDAGFGREGDFPPDAVGAIVLIQRRDVPFADMARRAEAARAIGVIVANRERGPFAGELEEPSALPAVAVGQEEGEELRAALQRGGVEVTVRVGELAGVTAHNVIARPPSGTCRTVSGAHLDTVPWAPGASDNASGSALVLELARAAAVAGLDRHCFALFGAEEFGLFGSAEFASRVSIQERAALEAAYVYDVVAGAEPPLALGTGVLQASTRELAGQLGIELDTGPDPSEIASDHLSFIEAGIPALLLTTPDYEFLHTIDDTVENLDPAHLDQMARLAFALLEEPAAGRLPAPSP